MTEESEYRYSVRFAGEGAPDEGNSDLSIEQAAEIARIYCEETQEMVYLEEDGDIICIYQMVNGKVEEK